MARVCVCLLVLVVAAYGAKPEETNEEVSLTVLPNGEVYDTKTGELLSTEKRYVDDDSADDIAKRFLWGRRRRRRRRRRRPRGQVSVGVNQNGIGGSYQFGNGRSRGSIHGGINHNGQYGINGGYKWRGRGGSRHSIQGGYSNGPNGPSWNAGYTFKFGKREVNGIQQKKP